MKAKNASEVDEIIRELYDNNLLENIDSLIARMKKQAYKPQLGKRVYIPKLGTKDKRTLGIPSYEEKLEQSNLAKILNAIYEQDFFECSFGFRPNKGCYDAIKLLDKIVKPNINYVVDTVIKGFYDNVDYGWMMKFLKHRIEDKNLLRLISRFLKVGWSVFSNSSKYLSTVYTRLMV